MSVDRLHPPERPEGLILLNRAFLVHYQHRLVTLFGGEPGLVDSPGLETLLKEARALSEMQGMDGAFALAALYGWRIAQGLFAGANRRLSLVCMGILLRLNLKPFSPEPAALIALGRDLGSGMTEGELEARLRRLSEASPPLEG